MRPGDQNSEPPTGDASLEDAADAAAAQLATDTAAAIASLRPQAARYIAGQHPLAADSD
ncbi:hypothetical protein [Streptomyces sp. NPDC054888]